MNTSSGSTYGLHHSGKKKAYKHRLFWQVSPPVRGESPGRVARVSKIDVLSSEDEKINLFA